MNTRPSMTIDGKPVESPTTFEVFDPATEEVVGLAPDCSPEQLDLAMDSARRAFPEWSRDHAARSEALKAAADRTEAIAEEVGAISTAEQGGVLAMSIGMVAYSAAWLRYYADMTLPEELVHDDAIHTARVVRRPLGPVAAITPWNAPILLAMWKISAALAAGNTMVLKPSPHTPLATLVFGAALNEVLPPGVLNIVSGRDPLGQLMAEHPVPRKVAVTGSIHTGKAVAMSAARGLKRVTLELGGNDPAIILADADVDAVANGVIMSAFGNSGQVCEAVKRVYVPQQHYDRFVDAFTERARALRVGHGMDPETQMGPLTTSFQRERVADLVDDAVARGGEVTTGGHRMPGPGYFYEPTVLRGVTDGVAIVDDEQFGPALPIVAYTDVEQVIDTCNASEYGLTASVWSSDGDRALDVARRLEVGRSKVNSHGGLPQFTVPFAGRKSSGIGAENGRAGMEDYTALQVLDVFHPQQAS